ncbi:hypothetical protein ACIOEZ_34515 [Streptomyces sp. NPDC087866]|uniref:hypothetical protein n=1 Tax=Streptomyces sp. NPDC087866 TaxID=3365815 RepID=UPI00382CBCB2
MTATREQLLHLADRARRGVALPDEGALLADGVVTLIERLEDQATADEVAERAARAIAAMGAYVRSARTERDRYRLAWKSARHRADLYLQSNQKLAASLDNGHASQLHAHKVAQSAARDAATALSRQLDAEAALDRARALAAEWGEPGHCSWLSASVLVQQLRAALDQAQQPTT